VGVLGEVRGIRSGSVPSGSCLRETKAKNAPAAAKSSRPRFSESTELTQVKKQPSPPPPVPPPPPPPPPIASKVATQRLGASIATCAVGLFPAQSPLQPAKSEPLLAVAVRLTCVPIGKVPWQIRPHATARGQSRRLRSPCPPSQPKEWCWVHRIRRFCKSRCLRRPFCRRE